MVMKERTTQTLLAAVILLLSALLVRDFLSDFRAQAQEKNQPAPVLRARSFELVDERGQVRAQMFLGQDGGGNIRLRDTTGNVRVKLGASTQGSTGLLLFDEEVNPAVEVITNKTGTILSLSEKGKEKRVIKP
jgi:hypothetical protein